jgi:LPPG:FO 2-phospho-L-lactate transferase
MITCLAGGVGAARFLEGLQSVVPPTDITVIINTGDDINLHGLHISPDIDIVTYTLAGIVNPINGWGIEGDTFNCLKALARLGHESWFNLGDTDLATHLSRTKLLAEGLTLSDITKLHAERLGVRVDLKPMTNDNVSTYIQTENGSLHFQDYLVHRGATDVVRGVEYLGADSSEAAPGVLEAIESADGVILCPSNPIVSIGTILSVPGVRGALRETKALVAAVSPIVGGKPIKGPADKLMVGMGIEVSASAVATLYRDFLDVFIMDTIDEVKANEVEQLGLEVVVCNTIMRSIEDKVKLSRQTMNAIGLI